MSNFNFYDFLDQNGYEKETIRDRTGKTAFTNYQKELSENIWNSLTVHKDKTISGANPYSNDIKFIRREQPQTIEEAKFLIKEIEEE